MADTQEYKIPLLGEEIHEEIPDCTSINGNNQESSIDIPECTDAIQEFSADTWDMPEISPIDPFRNGTYEITWGWETLKMVICLPLLIARLIFIGIFLAIGYICTKLALFKWERGNKAMPRWRSNIMWGTRMCARGILFCFGFHWIQRKGKPAPRDVAPIVVSNHVSFIDPMFYFYELFPTIVSSTSHNDMLFVGTIIRSMQVILVDRSSPHSRKDAISEIKRRATCSEFPRVLLFPEGTTTNGKALISFKPGAFVPGFPVQPVVVRYPHVHFDASWGSISLKRLLPRMLLQLHNFMQVQYLPVIYPSSNEMCQPRGFADRVKNTMARRLNIPETEHTYGDLKLSFKALELKLFPLAVFTLEMGKLEIQLQLSTVDALHYLERFSAMNLSRSGLLTKAEFLQSLGLSNTLLGEKVFRLLDREGCGAVNFQQFVVGSAYLSRDAGFIKLFKTGRMKCWLHFLDQ